MKVRGEGREGERRERGWEEVDPPVHIAIYSPTETMA